MKMKVVVGLLLVAGVAQAGVIETFQIGGLLAERNKGWSDNQTAGVHLITNAIDPDLVFTVTPVALNGAALSINGNHLAVNSVGDAKLGRINDAEQLMVTVSYVDPNSSLLALSVSAVGSYWGNNTDEITVFTDASFNSMSVTTQVSGAMSDYATSGLDALTKDNTDTWSMTVSVDDSLRVTQSALGGFQLQYEVVPEPATLGLVAMVGGGLLFIRRRFMI